MCTSILSSHYFYFPSLNCPNPLDILVGLVGPDTNSLIKAQKKSPPKLIHKWSIDFENPGDNDSKFKDHFKVYRSTNLN